jgi:phosphotransferase system enzyme I (PtsI)
MAKDRLHGKASRSGETIITARPVSRGVATGRAVSLHGRKLHFYKIQLSNRQIKSELKRFRSAVGLAKRQLEKLVRARSGSGKENAAASIFDVQRMFLEDEVFLKKVESTIEGHKVNAEWAVKTVTDDYINSFKKLTDEHLGAKYLDVEDTAERLISALGSKTSTLHVPKGSIIVAKELNPAALIELAESKPKAIVTERGGWTSHTFILARELNLPAVTGINHVLRRLKTGDLVVVDGNRGLAISNPKNAPKRSRKKVPAIRPGSVRASKHEKKGELRTLDGRRVIIRANVDAPKFYKAAKTLGAHGIGLYRSEFLFDRHKGFPNEEIQVEAYSAIVKAAGGDGVNIRTFDLNAEHLPDIRFEKESNPALGRRGIRLCLFHRRHFAVQLRAILKASAHGSVSICLPMVSDISEIIETRSILERERKKLAKAGTKVEIPPLGAMIEVPSAIFTIEEICGEVDFLCLGTNDLVQYLLAADRDNEAVADLFRTLHPAVIRAVKTTIDAASRAHKPLVICGEMAGSPFYLPVLVGLGADIFSMNVSSIKRIRQAVSGIAFEEAAEIAGTVRNSTSADEGEEKLRKYIRTHWSHVIDLEAMTNGGK